MAKKRRRKRGWIKSLLLFVIAPFIIWFLAFLIWYHWDGITKLFGTNKTKPPPKAVKKADSEKKTQEKIFDEDRKKLDEILKQRP